MVDHKGREPPRRQFHSAKTTRISATEGAMGGLELVAWCAVVDKTSPVQWAGN